MVFVFKASRVGTWFKQQFLAQPSSADTRITVGMSGGPTSNSFLTAPSDPRQARLIITSTTNGPREETPEQRRERRRLRRLERRRSITGLPLYSADPKEAEMTLMKYRPSSTTSRVDLTLHPNDSTATVNFDTNGSPDLDLASTLTSAPTVTLINNRSRSDSESSIYNVVYPTSSTHPPAYGIPPPSSTPSSPQLRPTSLRSSISADRPNLIRGSSSTSNLVLTSPLVMPGGRRSRASTMRSLFSRSDSGDRSARSSPYGEGARFGNRSVSSLSISNPLSHTLVTSSFVFPKAGITPDQLGFISSRSALGAFGHSADPPAFPTTEFDDTAFATMIEQGEFEEETFERPTLRIIDGRGRSSSSVSIGSPLRSMF